jgi:hypothetical protein
VRDGLKVDFQPVLRLTPPPESSAPADDDFNSERWRFRMSWARLRNRRRGVFGLPKARKCRAPGQDVSGMAPPSRMTRAQRSRIAANRGSMAALIFKNVCRLWRTILPAV